MVADKAAVGVSLAVVAGVLVTVGPPQATANAMRITTDRRDIRGLTYAGVFSGRSPAIQVVRVCEDDGVDDHADEAKEQVVDRVLNAVDVMRM